MTYWRMQLNPNDPQHAMEYTIESLAAGYIGLDWDDDPSNLTKAKSEELPKGERRYLAFAREMKVRDVVLIVVHQFPFALATVSGGYNYVRKSVPELGVWFRHFRKVRDVRYYSDHITDASSWPRLLMTETLLPLRDPTSDSYKLIEQWLIS